MQARETAHSRRITPGTAGAGADYERHVDVEAELFASLYPKLRSFARLWASDGQDPDDLVQEALAGTLRVHSLDELENPEAYLRRAISNVSKNHFRRRGHIRFETLNQDAHSPSSHDVYPSDTDWLGSLRPRQRVAMYLIDVEGRSYREAAELMHVSDKSVKAAVRRARRRALDLRRSTDG